MKYTAVICEFDPFHNGHEYILRRARELGGCDKVIALMSGNFVQRGTPAVMDEYSRAECALACGADIVLELPVIYATASGERFARGAIDVLNGLGIVDNIVMGAENADVDKLMTIADIRARETAEHSAALRRYLDDGLPYARALTEATADEAEKRGLDHDEITEMLTRPNNILAVAYAQALLETNSRIHFIPAERVGGRATDELTGTYSSASAIRNSLHDDAISLSIPPSAYAILKRELAAHPVRADIYGTLLLYELGKATPEQIAEAPDCAEGLEYRISECARVAMDQEELTDKIHTPRYTRRRIVRICLQTLLGITKCMQSSGYDFTRLLGLKRSALPCLADLPETVIRRKTDEALIPDELRAIYLAEKNASRIYSLISRRRDEFYRKMMVVD